MGKSSERLMRLGLLLVLAGLLLTAYNYYEDWQSRKAMAQAITVLDSLHHAPISAHASQTVSVEGGLSMEAPAPTAVPTGEPEALEMVPAFILDPEMEMPEVLIDGEWYIGCIDIPQLKVSLPVMSTWSYPQLKLSPCRYMGSVYTKNLIVCGHNYPSHFGQANTLIPGDEVFFTDIAGNVFFYEVIELETLHADDSEKMQSGSWDLTFFTCTLGGENRVTVRCRQTGYSTAGLTK